MMSGVLGVAKRNSLQDSPGNLRAVAQRSNTWYAVYVTCHDYMKGNKALTVVVCHHKASLLITRPHSSLSLASNL